MMMLFVVFWFPCCSIFSFCVMFCSSLFVLILFAIVFIVLLRFMASDNSFDIFKPFFLVVKDSDYFVVCIPFMLWLIVVVLYFCIHTCDCKRRCCKWRHDVAVFIKHTFTIGNPPRNENRISITTRLYEGPNHLMIAPLEINVQLVWK